VHRQIRGAPVRQHAQQAPAAKVLANQPVRQQRHAQAGAHRLANARHPFREQNGIDRQCLFCALWPVKGDLVPFPELDARQRDPRPPLQVGRPFHLGATVHQRGRRRQVFLSNQSVQNLKHSGDPVGALQQAYQMLQASVQTNSFVMAYSECFLAIAFMLLIGSATIWLCNKTKATGAAAAH
jgi:hypothetical protein